MCFGCAERCPNCLYVNEGWKDGKRKATVVKRMCYDCFCDTDFPDGVEYINHDRPLVPPLVHGGMPPGLHKAALDAITTTSNRALEFIAGIIPVWK